jgi:hypothetical protein
MNYSSLIGQFANGSSFWDDGFLWDVSYGANQLDVTAVRSPERSSLLLLCIGFAALDLCAQRKMAKTRALFTDSSGSILNERRVTGYCSSHGCSDRYEPDRMYLNPRQIIFVETVGTNSKTAQLIAQAPH